MALADDIAALEAAIRRGVKSVSYDGHQVTYQSRDDMVKTLRSLKKQAGTIDAGGIVYPEWDKGT